MENKKKRIAIVGGGAAGLGAICMVLEEPCLEPICFEKTDRPCGTWNYREESYDGVGSIMPTTIINQSKEIGAISKYPPKKECPNFMRHHELLRYFLDFGENFGAMKYMQFNTEAILVKRSDDYEETGKWVITVRDTITGNVSTDVYDGVLVCVGHINRPKMPNFPGQDKFQGQISHTHTLKGVESYKDKNVVVVGMGCSGLDAAVDTSTVANQVYLSTRSGAHVIRRIGPHGYPFDYILMRRWIFKLMDILPFHMVSWLLEKAFTDFFFNPKLYAVPPDHHILSKDPIINDSIASKLNSGSVIQKRDINRFVEDGVVFEGDTEITKADAVIMATGYTWGFPFLEEGIVVKEGNIFNLYKLMYPPHLPHATLALIGFLLPFGPGFPPGELQLRWAVQVLKGKFKLPSKDDMDRDIKRRYELNLPRYTQHDKMSLHVEIIHYCDEIASLFGAKPNLWKIFFTDPALYCKLMFGPSVPYQYRLQGPHAWEGAREAIMTSKSRMLYPFTNNEKTQQVKPNVFQVLFIKCVQFLLGY